MKVKLMLYCVISAVSILVISCKKSNSGINPTPSVYILGIDTRGVDCYWKDGVVSYFSTPLSTNTINSIFVSGDDVYVSGYQTDSFSTATYWKNGMPIKIST